MHYDDCMISYQPSDIAFMIDHMMLKLGKYVRIIGYDAAWDTTLRTHELIDQANSEGRIFLTRNRHIPDQYPEPKEWLCIQSDNPVIQLSEVVSAYGLDQKSYVFSRCIRCNVVLEDIKRKHDVEHRVHPNVFKRHNHFYTCPSCHTVFWKGSHVTNTCNKLGLAG